jgi:hypothetical protein
LWVLSGFIYSSNSTAIFIKIAKISKSKITWFYQTTHSIGPPKSHVGQSQVNFPGLAQGWVINPMINVRMGEDSPVDGAWIKGNLAVSFAGLLASVLEEIAIQEQFKAVDFEQVD